MPTSGEESNPNVPSKPIKCSAVSTMERSMPDHDYSAQVNELKQLMLEDIDANPKRYSEKDIKSIHDDPWFCARYLLRVKLDVKAAYQMMRKALEFRNSPIVSVFQFPEEFYKIGALFTYEPDRKGNIPVYMRIKVYQKIPIVQRFLKAFLFNVIEESDKRAHGKGIVLVFDLQGAGISNVDMDLLFFVITTLVNYFPKGLSYMLVHQLPWIMRSFWTIARQWLSEDHKDLVKFSDQQTIYEYFDKENLPDFMGGSCERDYRQIANNCISLKEAAERWDLDEQELYKIRKRFANDLPKTCSNENLSADISHQTTTTEGARGG